jgi:arsenate reductase
MPVSAHWGIPDPAAATGTEADIEAAFVKALNQLRNRIGLFVSLPLATIDGMTIQKRLREIQANALKSDDDGQ